VPEAVDWAIKKIRFRKQLPTTLKFLREGENLIKEAQKCQDNGEYKKAITLWREYLEFYDESRRTIVKDYVYKYNSQGNLIAIVEIGKLVKKAHILL